MRCAGAVGAAAGTGAAALTVLGAEPSAAHSRARARAGSGSVQPVWLARRRIVYYLVIVVYYLRLVIAIERAYSIRTRRHTDGHCPGGSDTVVSNTNIRRDFGRVSYSLSLDQIVDSLVCTVQYAIALLPLNTSGPCYSSSCHVAVHARGPAQCSLSQPWRVLSLCQ